MTELSRISRPTAKPPGSALTSCARHAPLPSAATSTMLQKRNPRPAGVFGRNAEARPERINQCPGEAGGCAMLIVEPLISLPTANPPGSALTVGACEIGPGLS